MRLRRIVMNPISRSFTLSTACAVAVAACGGGGGGSATSMGAQQSVNQFADRALVVDTKEVVATSVAVDANLQNPWGIAFAPAHLFGSPITTATPQHSIAAQANWRRRE
jgi:hypothetical protein